MKLVVVELDALRTLVRGDQLWREKMKAKLTALLALVGGVSMAVGINCIPNVGTVFSGLTDALGLGDLLAGLTG